MQAVKNSYYETVDELRIPPEDLASMMIDLQKRSEAGEDVSRLIADIASVLAERHTKRKRS